jgi:hypothetical protein
LREDNIKMDLKEVGWEDVDWIILVKDFYEQVMNFWLHKRQEISLPIK